jgi:hypothetical protein
MARKSNLNHAGPADQAALEQAAQAPQPKPQRDKFQKVFVLNAEQRRRLDSYCGEANTTIQEVVLEGINLVFRSKGLPEI